MAAKPVVPAAGFSFTSFTAAAPAAPLPGGSLDSELTQLRVTESEIIAWAAGVVNDTGALRAGAVTPRTLSSEVASMIISGWNPRGTWVTETAYALNDYVRDVSENAYVCIEAHTSGADFATDLTAEKWILVSVASSTAGHVLKLDGVSAAVRAALNFSTAFTLTDDSDDDETDLGLNFGTGSGQPAEGNHNHDGVYATAGHKHLSSVIDTAVTREITAEEHGKLIRATDALTLTLEAASNLGDGFICYVRADGGTLTIDPSGSETIDGETTLEIATGDSAVLISNGTGIFTVRGVSGGGGSGTLTGEVRMYAGGTVPSGWLLCQGQAISRTTYAALFFAIGTAYGTGDGSTTFNLPDARGRSPIGSGRMNGTGTDRVLGTKGGAETHTLSSSEIPVHAHAAGTLTATAVGDHTHPGTTSIAALSGNNFGDENNIPSGTTTGAGGAHGHSITGSTANAGSGGAHTNMHPWAAFNFIIKT